MVVIIDYGMGNLFSIQAALNFLGAESVISSEPAVIDTAAKLILPGVGSFFKAMENVRKSGLLDVVQKAVNVKRTPILGICLGMQLMGLSSTEDGFTSGFGFIDTVVERFDENACANLKIPHVGFDAASVETTCKLFDGLQSPSDFYFTHSYRMAYTGQPYAVSLCAYGEKFIAAFEKEHICGTQFHPEKSQTNGLLLLKNFVEKF